MDELEPITDQQLITVFVVHGSAFGIDATLVQEVLRVGTITHVHHASSKIVGIRNLRGYIITVIDAKALMGLGNITLSAESRILIMLWQGESIGLLVDGATESILIDRANISPAPANALPGQHHQLLGVYQHKDRLISLIDPEILTNVDDHTHPLAPRALSERIDSTASAQG